MTTEDPDLKLAKYVFIQMQIRCPHMNIDKAAFDELLKALKQARAEGFEAGRSWAEEAAIEVSEPLERSFERHFGGSLERARKDSMIFGEGRVKLSHIPFGKNEWPTDEEIKTAASLVYLPPSRTFAFCAGVRWLREWMDK